MKIKLDENLPTELAELLRGLGHDVHTVPEESLTGSEDPIVFSACVAESRLLITQNLDFSDAHQFRPGTHAGVALVRLKHASRRALIERFRTVLQDHSIDDGSKCFVVLSDHKLRVLRPE